MGPKKLLMLLAAAITLAACDPSDLTPADKAAICQAVVGPIRYNTYNPKSHRYAADQLAPDLKVRNQIGSRLGCPTYRSWK